MSVCGWPESATDRRPTVGRRAACGAALGVAVLLLRKKGASHFEAITQAGTRRFRPILLTTLTTFGGLARMIFETSRQARFLIPMALSLGYGILFATSITLILVPSFYLIVEDARGLFVAGPAAEPQEALDTHRTVG